MNSTEPAARLPGATLVQLAARLVPLSHRDDWRAEWLGEIAWAWERSGRSRRDGVRLRARSCGALADALWLRRRLSRPEHSRSAMLTNDVHFAVRSLRRTPSFTAIVVGTLALCIGATTTVFSVVESVLLNGLGYQRLDQLVAVWSNNVKEGNDHYQASVGDYNDWRARSHSFSHLAAFFPTWNALYASPDGVERIDVGAVSANFLRALGVAPSVGRDFADGEDRPGAPGVVIITHQFWSRALQGDQRVVGKSLTFDGKPYVIVGVMDRRFTFPGSKVDILLPLSILGSYLDRREVHLVSVVGRLRDGVTLDAARREMAPVTEQVVREHPKDDAGLGITVRPLADDLLGNIRRPILFLFGAVCAVLLIGCANVTNLMLGRAWSRRNELAVRAAIGAAPGAIVQQLLVESGVIALASAGLGVAVAFLASRALVTLLPVSISRIGGLGVNVEVLAFTVAAGLVVTFLCGTSPALHGAREALRGTLVDTARGSRGRGTRRMYRALVVGELAMALVLTVSAGLLITSVSRLTSTDAGFRRDGIVRMKVALPNAAYPSGRPRLQFYDRLLGRVRALPGVRAVTLVNRFPLHDGNVTTAVAVEGETPADGIVPSADIRMAGIDYFTTMGIALVAGRSFENTDNLDSGATPVLVINETAARKIFHSSNPIGRHVTLGGPGPLITVIGVVRDVHDASLREAPNAQVFMSTNQAAPSTTSLVVRYDGPVGPVVSEMRRIVASLDKSVPMFDVETIGDVFDRASMNDRFTMTLLSGFALLALVLAAIGTYGVMASGVSERTREIGVRIALGARSQDVAGMIAREGAILFAVALPIALTGVWATTRAIRSLLFGVAPTDPKTVALAAAALAVATAVACYVPARRAARMDPLTALRAE